MRSAPTTSPSSEGDDMGGGQIVGVELLFGRHVLLADKHLAAQRHGEIAEIGKRAER